MKSAAKKSHTKKKIDKTPRVKTKHYGRSALCVIAILIVMTGVAGIRGISMREQNALYTAQEVELREQIKAAQERSAEIDELEQYVGSDEYIRETAREKLGMVGDNEILFRADE